MLAATETLFPTTEQSPEPTSNAPVTRTDVFKTTEKGVSSASSPIGLSIEIRPEPLHVIRTAIIFKIIH